MPINLNDNINILAPLPNDHRYGPYSSVQSARNSVTSNLRHSGLTVGVGTPIVEYWWKNGLSDNDLILKNEATISDTTVVRTTGSQNIDGTKTFTKIINAISGININYGDENLNFSYGNLLDVVFDDRGYLFRCSNMGNGQITLGAKFFLSGLGGGSNPFIIEPYGYTTYTPNPIGFDQFGNIIYDTPIPQPNAAVMSGYWRASPIEVDKGGTGRTSYTNGQILIGSGNSLVANTLTAGSGISIVNGSGTVTIHATGTTNTNTTNNFTINISNQTVNNTPNIVLQNNVNGVNINPLIISEKTTWTFDIKVSAYNDTDSSSAGWIFRGVAKRNGANQTTILGNVITEFWKDTAMELTNVDVIANNSGGVLQVRVTGLPSRTIKWTASANITQVK